MECTKKKRSEWLVRLGEEIKEDKNGIFVTLTFNNDSYKSLYNDVINEAYKEINKLYNSKSVVNSNEKLIENIKIGIKGYDMENKIATLAVRRFLERWRKKYKKSVRHWLVTELGQKNTEHLHLHGIIWTDKGEEINKIWKYGYTWTGYEKNEKKVNYVNDKTINYITKYITKTDEKHKEYKSIILCSPGIGKNYTNSHNANNNKYKEENTEERYITRTGIKIALPIYYRNKIYSEEEREKLWVEKLDKQKRYVNGIEIDVSKNHNEYFKALEYYRKLNKELGYGDDKKKLEANRI